MNRLQGKHVLITGASQGLGRQLAITFAREGATGIAIAARGVECLNEVSDYIYEVAPKTQVLVVVADLTRQEDIERVVATTLISRYRSREPYL